jgi:hypothetical protein
MQPIFDQQRGVWWDPSTGYIYDQNMQLWYDPATGRYLPNASDVVELVPAQNYNPPAPAPAPKKKKRKPVPAPVSTQAAELAELRSHVRRLSENQQKQASFFKGLAGGVLLTKLLSGSGGGGCGCLVIIGIIFALSVPLCTSMTPKNTESTQKIIQQEGNRQVHKNGAHNPAKP